LIVCSRFALVLGIGEDRVPVAELRCWVVRRDGKKKPIFSPPTGVLVEDGKEAKKFICRATWRDLKAKDLTTCRS